MMSLPTLPNLSSQGLLLLPSPPPPSLSSPPLKLSPVQTLKFPTTVKPCALSPSSLRSSSSFRVVGNDDNLGGLDFEDDEHVIGDCLVFEEDAFEDPYLKYNDSPDGPGMDKSLTANSKKGKRKKKKKEDVEEDLAENLVPEEWREVQAEINITKKERRKIAQEIEFNSRVQKKKSGYAPIRALNLEEYQAYREAKLAQLKPIVLDNPSGFPDKEQEEEEEEEQEEEEGKKVESERVEPKNPRWAVYGRGFDDVTEFFNSGVYEPGQKQPEGPRKLFSKEEKVLLNRRIPDLAAATSSKWLPLHTLAASGEFYLVDALLKHNVDINAVDVGGLTALHKAIIGKKQAVTNYLLRESANPFVQDTDGATLLHYAVQTASCAAIKVLLLYNVDINLQDNDGWTPLHLAVQTRRTDVVKLLLIKGADKTLRSKDGLTPLDLCLYSGRDTRTYELIKLLKQMTKKSTGSRKKPSSNVTTSQLP